MHPPGAPAAPASRGANFALRPARVAKADRHAHTYNCAMEGEEQEQPAPPEEQAEPQSEPAPEAPPADEPVAEPEAEPVAEAEAPEEPAAPEEPDEAEAEMQVNDPGEQAEPPPVADAATQDYPRSDAADAASVPETEAREVNFVIQPEGYRHSELVYMQAPVAQVAELLEARLGIPSYALRFTLEDGSQLQRNQTLASVAPAVRMRTDTISSLSGVSRADLTDPLRFSSPHKAHCLACQRPAPALQETNHAL